MSNHIWYPFTKIHRNTKSENLNIVRGDGSYLYDKEGKKYIDLVSSWWVNVHGHCNPYISSAIKDQLDKLEHVIFAGFTHDPAIKLADMLIGELNKNNPNQFTKVFYSDNGSTAIEVAIKMAYQSHINRGDKKKIFVCFEGCYHGDTFGCMSVGKSSGFYGPFEDRLLDDVKVLPYPDTWAGDVDAEEKNRTSLKEIEDFFAKNYRDIAFGIIEPIVRGASGMRMANTDFMNGLMDLFKKYDIISIFDEVMTGFGKTGKMFAFQNLSHTPDIICLSKGITGGFLPLGATVCGDKIYQSFIEDDNTGSRFFAHGHSFAGNPIICASAVASLELFEKNKVLSNVAEIEKVHQKMLTENNHGVVRNVRWFGAIGAFDFNSTKHSVAEANLIIKRECLKEGIIIRPLGDKCYIMPPLVANINDLADSYKKLFRVIYNSL